MFLHVLCELVGCVLLSPSVFVWQQTRLFGVFLNTPWEGDVQAVSVLGFADGRGTRLEMVSYMCLSIPAVSNQSYLASYPDNF